MGKQEKQTGINTPHYAEKIGEQTPQVSVQDSAAGAERGPADLRNVREQRCRRFSRSSDTLARGTGRRRGSNEDWTLLCSSLSALPGCIILAKEGSMESLTSVEVQHLCCTAVFAGLQDPSTQKYWRMSEICRL